MKKRIICAGCGKSIDPKLVMPKIPRNKLLKPENFHIACLYNFRKKLNNKD